LRASHQFGQERFDERHIGVTQRLDPLQVDV
jgi:hypothetical protein